MKQFVYTGQDNLEVMSQAKNYNKFLVSLVNRSPASIKALDFGAGTGTYAEMLRDEGFAIDCLEPDEKQAKLLKSKKFTVIKNINDVKKSSYDVIYSFNVFEHIEDDLGVARVVSEKLKPGGLFVVYVPAFQLLYSAMDRKVEHHRRYRIERLRAMADQSAMSIVNIQYCDPLGFPAALVYKLIGSKKGDISPTAVSIYDKYIFPISRVLESATKKLFGKNALIIMRKR